MPPNRSTKGAAQQEVLTLAEAAKYLRVSQDVLRRWASLGMVPGRRIDDEWRFLKAALQDWLRVAPPEDGAPAKSSKERLLDLVGIWKDDPTVDEMLENIYKERGRPMIDPNPTG